MKTQAVNPWNWSQEFGFHQGQIVEEAKRYLICSGQTSVDPNGRPMHAGNMRDQLTLSLDNLETLLAKAGMTLHNLIGVKIYATDMQSLMQHWDVLLARFAQVAIAPPMSVLGVSCLVMPEFMVEIEATAAD